MTRPVIRLPRAALHVLSQPTAQDGRHLARHPESLRRRRTGRSLGEGRREAARWRHAPGGTSAAGRGCAHDVRHLARDRARSCRRRVAESRAAAAFHRLNRTEYQNAIRDLLALELDVSRLLPADDAAYGFDNVSDVLSISPARLDAYLSAARRISRLAVGDPTASPEVVTYAAGRRCSTPAPIPRSRPRSDPLRSWPPPAPAGISARTP